VGLVVEGAEGRRVGGVRGVGGTLHPVEGRPHRPSTAADPFAQRWRRDLASCGFLSLNLSMGPFADATIIRRDQPTVRLLLSLKWIFAILSVAGMMGKKYAMIMLNEHRCRFIPPPLSMLLDKIHHKISSFCQTVLCEARLQILRY